MKPNIEPLAPKKFSPSWFVSHVIDYGYPVAILLSPFVLVAGCVLGFLFTASVDSSVLTFVFVIGVVLTAFAGLFSLEFLKGSSIFLMPCIFVLGFANSTVVSIAIFR